MLRRMSGLRKRLVGVELFSDRAGDSTAFYSWLLGPGAGSAPSDWSAINLLFEHGVCGVRRCGSDGPTRSCWIPVLAVDDLDETLRRAAATGFVEHRREDLVYVGRRDSWIRLVPADPLPAGLAPDMLGTTTVEYQTPDPPASADRLRGLLDLEVLELVDDPGQYRLLVQDGVLTLGVVDMSTFTQAPLDRAWLVYFDVPDIPGTVRRAADAGIEVVVPPVDEGYTHWAILRDPFGIVFGLCHWRDLTGRPELVRDASGRERPFGDAVRWL